MIKWFCSSALLFVQVSAQVSMAALPPQPPSKTECREKRRLSNVDQVLGMNPEQVMWDCMDLSALAKTDLLQVAKVAPAMRMQTSGTALSREDLLEVHRTKPLTLDVNSDRFSRTDLLTLQKAGVQVVLQSQWLMNFNVNDYREIARGGPVTLELGTTSMTAKDIRELASEPNLRLVIDPAKANLSATDQQEILRTAPETRIIF
jgi:hypothetical protein